MNAYALTDELYLWWLGKPAEAAIVGVIRLANAGRAVSLQYSPNWLEHGFALSEDLPLIDQEHLPAEKDTAAGAIDDARPDRWGERVIRLLDKPPRLSLLEYLYFAGDDRFGALGVSTSGDQYLPRRSGPLPRLGDVNEIQELVRKVKANEELPEHTRRLLAPGVTMGGLRPKGLIEIDGEQWVVKFRDEDPWDTPLIEHACMTLAKKAAITVSLTKAVSLREGHAIAIKRFDRQSNHRIHAQSARVALRAEGSEMGYPELAQLLRRRAPTSNGSAQSQMKELFKRMIFNILMDNTDDHERNHVLLMDDAQHLSLSPAFDVLPTGQSLGYQQMRVGKDRNDSTVTNALSQATLFGLTPKEAQDAARQVAAVCSKWQDHFTACNVTPRDIDLLTPHIDRQFLKDQRTALAV